MPAKLIPLPDYRSYPEPEMVARARELREVMTRRRSVREFSSRNVPDEVIESCLGVALSAPSGANLQPWHFTVVRDPAIKKRIREAAEAEERDFYDRRAPREWLDALEPIGTDTHKPFLETAPVLIAIFGQIHGIAADGSRVKHYYVHESVGIASGMLIAAIHLAGLVCLTHTPAPMKFLCDILERPSNERPYLLLPIGYPADDAKVPDIHRRAFEESVTRV
jgi:nitroreductase